MAKAKARSLGAAGGTMPRGKPYSEMGVSGTAIYAGYIRILERSSDWVGRQRYIKSSEIVVNASIVAAGVHYFLNLIAHPKWSVKPNPANDKSAEAIKAAEFVESVLHDMKTPWSRVVRRAGMYRFHGFGIQEWIAKKRKDGNVGISDVEPRPQHTIERWDVTDEGVVNGVWQRSPQTGVLHGLPRNKLIYIVDDTLTDSPEGLGLFRHLHEPFERLKQYLTLELRGFERDLRGIPIGRAPITAINRLVAAGELKKEEATALIDGMKRLIEIELKKSNTGLLLDSLPYEYTSQDGTKFAGTPQWGFELLSGPAAGFGELSNAIDRTQREMARIIGVEHLMMGDQGGNRALAVDKSRNLYLIANSVLENIASSFEHDLIDPLWLLNGWDDETKPKLETEDVTFKDVDQITGALARMAQAGAVLAPDDPAIGDIRDILGVERPKPIDADMMGALAGAPAVDGGAELDLDGNDKTIEPQQGTRAEASRVDKNKLNGQWAKPIEKAIEKAILTLEKSGSDSAVVVVDSVGLAKYDPDQPRDESGRWTDGGGDGSGSGDKNSDEAVSEELKSAFRQLADQQRGTPEMMFHDAHNPGVSHGAGLWQYHMEHAGDLIHRAAQADLPGYGLEALYEKTRKLQRDVTRAYGFEREINENIKNNYTYALENGKYSGSLEQWTEEAYKAGKRYADAYRKLKPITEMQRLGRDAAIALGERRFRDYGNHIKSLYDLVTGPNARELYFTRLTG